MYVMLLCICYYAYRIKIYDKKTLTLIYFSYIFFQQNPPKYQKWQIHC